MTSNRYEINDEIYISDQITYEDIPSLIKYLNNPTIYANTLAIPYPYTTKDGEDFINMMKSRSNDICLFFTIRLNTTNELIGACGLFRSSSTERKAEIGYWIAEPYWNRGLVPKVVTKVLEIGKINWNNVVRFQARIFSWNKASMRVVEKCGFLFEGILRKYVHKNGEDIDVHSYSLVD